MGHGFRRIGAGYQNNLLQSAFSVRSEDKIKIFIKVPLSVIARPELFGCNFTFLYELNVLLA
jgi:hypothetical protein